MALLVLICNARTPVIVAHTTSSRDPGSFSANGLHRSPVFEHPPAPSPLHYLSGPGHSTSTSHAVQLSRLPFATLNHFNPQTNTLVRIGKCEGEGRYSNLELAQVELQKKGNKEPVGPFQAFSHILSNSLLSFSLTRPNHLNVLEAGRSNDCDYAQISLSLAPPPNNTKRLLGHSRTLFRPSDFRSN
jgi:hypothetical protein